MIGIYAISSNTEQMRIWEGESSAIFINQP